MIEAAAAVTVAEAVTAASVLTVKMAATVVTAAEAVTAASVLTVKMAATVMTFGGNSGA
jgi:hypothetical protein